MLFSFAFNFFVLFFNILRLFFLFFLFFCSSFTREEIRRILSFEADGPYKRVSFLAKRRPDALVDKEKYNAWHQRLLTSCEPHPAWLFDTDQLLSPAPGTFKMPEAPQSEVSPSETAPKTEAPRTVAPKPEASKPGVPRFGVLKFERQPFGGRTPLRCEGAARLFSLPRKRLLGAAGWEEEEEETPQMKRREVMQQERSHLPQQESFLNPGHLYGPEKSIMDVEGFFRPSEFDLVSFSM